jgi:hypothetical protein
MRSGLGRLGLALLKDSPATSDLWTEGRVLQRRAASTSEH